MWYFAHVPRGTYLPSVYWPIPLHLQWDMLLVLVSGNSGTPGSHKIANITRNDDYLPLRFVLSQILGSFNGTLRLLISISNVPCWVLIFPMASMSNTSIDHILVNASWYHILNFVKCERISMITLIKRFHNGGRVSYIELNFYTACILRPKFK